MVKVVILKIQPLSKHLRGKNSETAKYRIPLRLNKIIIIMTREKKVHLGLNIIIRSKFTTNFNRCAMLIVRNSLTKDVEPDTNVTEN